jgi:hypothetical protein
MEQHFPDLKRIMGNKKRLWNFWRENSKRSEEREKRQDIERENKKSKSALPRIGDPIHHLYPPHIFPRAFLVPVAVYVL